MVSPAKFLALAVAIGLTLLCQSTATAAIEYELGNLEGGGFSSSYLHSASAHTNNNDASMSGQISQALGAGYDRVKVNRNGNVLTILPSEIDVQVGGLMDAFSATSTTDSLKLKLTGGVLVLYPNDIYDPDAEYADGFIGGFINYEVTAGAVTSQAGTFFFEPKQIGADNVPVNKYIGSGGATIGLWGNNWEYSDGDWRFLTESDHTYYDPAFTASGSGLPSTAPTTRDAVGVDLGIDLGLFETYPDIEPVPEPTALVVWSLLGLVALALGFHRRAAAYAR